MRQAFRGVRRLRQLLIFLMLLSVLSGSCAAENTIDPKKLVQNILEGSTLYYLDETEALKPYYDKAAERKTAILNSETQIVKSDEFIRGETYTGTAYYVSPSGNDENDGLSPSRAWKTTERVNGSVNEGDAVFFERGGIYRLTERPIFLSTDVTYSAYGEGAKPVITLAQENSARSGCWEIWYEGEGGEKIWRYYRQIGDVCGIVLDDESYAKRVMEWPTPNGWLALDFTITDPANGYYSLGDYCGNLQMTNAGEYRTVEENLTEDLTYISRIDISSLRYPVDLSATYRAGDLYLRCDAGNPGECFSDIAIIAAQPYANGESYDTLVDGGHADGWVLDNLSLKHYGTCAVFCFLQRGKNAVIQNCTVEWGGNRLFSFQSSTPFYDYSLIGDSIYCFANHATIRNNYMRQGGNGFTFESNWENVSYLGTYIAEGNLIENCGQGMRISLARPLAKYVFDEIILRDNIILDTGNSMNNACFEQAAALDLGIDPSTYAKRFEISGNVMLGCTVTMIRIPDSSVMEMPIDFHDNVIAQARNSALICECAWNYVGKPVWHMMKNAKK